MLIDTHCHLFMLQHDPLEKILERAKVAGITKMISVATDPSNWETNQKIVEEIPEAFYTLGIHPHEAEKHPDGPAAMEKALATASKKCVGIGETGLDYYYEHSPPASQQACFRRHLEIAKSANLPVVIHCRDAFDELYQIIDDVKLGAAGGVMHCFTGNREQAKGALARGLKISFSGIISFKNAESLREAAKQIPLSEMLLETDCPFLAPIPYRGKPNEPSYLPMTALALASTLNLEVEKVNEATSKNASQLFKI